MDHSVHDILAAAAQDVETANVPDDLRVAAFSAAVALRTAGGVDQASPSQPSRTTKENTGWGSPIATALGVSEEDVGEAFDLVEDRMHLTIPPSRLPSQRAAAMKDVALLICAARQSASLDTDGYTAVDVIRDECRELGVLDASNFASEIGRLADYMSFRGSGRSRHLRVNRRGLEQAGQRLRELLRRE